MGTARTRCATLAGIDGHLVQIAAETVDGPPGLALGSLAEPGIRETRDRVRAAILNSGESWPQQRLTITLTGPSHQGSTCDLAIAVAVLAAAGQVPSPADEVALIGELGLDGALRPVRGVLPLVSAAVAAGCGQVIVPQDNVAEAALEAGACVIGAPDLARVLRHLRARPAPAVPTTVRLTGAHPARLGEHLPGAGRPWPDLADVPGQPVARFAAEVCAAGGHHLLLTGPPAADRVMIAERLPGLLPPLDPDAALEVTAIHSAAGVLQDGEPLVTEPPLCSPHHSATKAAIIGGAGAAIRPGATALAHRGVLHLEDAPEFDRDVLAALRQPLESGEVVVARPGLTARFPARFLLVLTARLCPCGQAGAAPQACTCTPLARRRYLGRLAGPLLERVDVQVQMRPAGRAGLLAGSRHAEPSAVVAARVAAARQRAAQRLASTPWRLNAEVPGAELRRRFPAAPGAVEPLQRAVDLGQLGVHGMHGVLRVAWTLADLAGKPCPGTEETSRALELRLGTCP